MIASHDVATALLDALSAHRLSALLGFLCAPPRVALLLEQPPTVSSETWNPCATSASASWRVQGFDHAISRLAHPIDVARQVQDRWPAVGEAFAEGRAPRTSLNRPIGSHRRLAVRAGLAGGTPARSFKPSAGRHSRDQRHGGCGTPEAPPKAHRPQEDRRPSRQWDQCRLMPGPFDLVAVTAIRDRRGAGSGALERSR
jgi:hypothetical protein